MADSLLRTQPYNPYEDVSNNVMKPYLEGGI